MIRETREAIEAYCVAVGLVAYEWNICMKSWRVYSLSSARETGRKPSWSGYAIRSDMRQREKLRCATTETTSDQWKKSPRAPEDLGRVPINPTA
jgi:hypothetical protein